MMQSFRQQGLTLVELMVAATLGLVIMAGVIQLFISSKETYRINSFISQIQESGRFAIEAVAHDLRMAGYQGCADPKAVPPVNLVLNSAPVTHFKETSIIGGEGGASADELLIRYASPQFTPLMEPSDPVNATLAIEQNTQNFTNGM